MEKESLPVPGTPPADPRRILPDTRRRDTLIALTAGVAMLAFLVYAVTYFSRQVNASGMAEGIILSKSFVPQAETEITVGKGGLDSRHIAGEYSFQVRVPQENDREYKVLVDPSIYETRLVGDHLLFKEPP